MAKNNRAKTPRTTNSVDELNQDDVNTTESTPIDNVDVDTTPSTLPREEASSPSVMDAINELDLTTLADLTPVADEVPVPSAEEYYQQRYGVDIANPPEKLAHIIERIQEYVKLMANNSIMDDVRGKQLQKKLFVTYEKALMLEAPLNFAAMDYILATINEHISSAFRVEMVTRFTKNNMWSHEDTLMFNSLNALFIHIADPLTRIARLSNLNIGAIVSRYPDERANITDGLMDYLNHSR